MKLQRGSRLSNRRTCEHHRHVAHPRGLASPLGEPPVQPVGMRWTLLLCRHASALRRDVGDRPVVDPALNVPATRERGVERQRPLCPVNAGAQHGCAARGGARHSVTALPSPSPVFPSGFTLSVSCIVPTCQFKSYTQSFTRIAEPHAASRRSRCSAWGPAQGRLRYGYLSPLSRSSSFQVINRTSSRRWPVRKSIRTRLRAVGEQVLVASQIARISSRERKRSRLRSLNRFFFPRLMEATGLTSIHSRSSTAQLQNALIWLTTRLTWTVSPSPARSSISSRTCALVRSCNGMLPTRLRTCFSNRRSVCRQDFWCSLQCSSM